MFGNLEQADFSNAIADCYRSAVAAAEMNAVDVGSINAEAAGSLVGDAAEAQAINSVFGNIPVVANKGNFGNLGPGTSAVESVAAILGLSHKTLPPTLNCDEAGSDCPVNVLGRVTDMDPHRPQAILKSSISATGQIAAVIFKGDCL
jgi:3-oxoacyl-[acyl-carrier-protein] synthase II